MSDLIPHSDLGIGLLALGLVEILNLGALTAWRPDQGASDKPTAIAHEPAPVEVYVNSTPTEVVVEDQCECVCAATARDTSYSIRGAPFVASLPGWLARGRICRSRLLRARLDRHRSHWTSLQRELR